MMKGYSKMKGNHSFNPRSSPNKEFLFVDKDFELLASKSQAKKTHLNQYQQHEEEPRNIIDEDQIKKKKNDSFFLGKTEEFDDDYDGEKNRGILKRNSSISSSASYQKNIKNNNKGSNNNNHNKMNISLERQSSTRAIQEAVKRAFSIKRSSSVNSDRYSRIHDQPISMMNDDYDFDSKSDLVYHNNHDEYNNNNNNNNHDYDDINHSNQDYDFERIGSLETRSMKKNHERRYVGSKVVRACKRLFSR